MKTTTHAIPSGTVRTIQRMRRKGYTLTGYGFGFGGRLELTWAPCILCPRGKCCGHSWFDRVLRGLS